jgi:hypothetical protein
MKPFKLEVGTKKPLSLSLSTKKKPDNVDAAKRLKTDL